MGRVMVGVDDAVAVLAGAVAVVECWVVVVVILYHQYQHQYSVLLLFR